MPAVLTAASTITCAGTGTVATSGESKLKVSGSGVLLVSGVRGKDISGCKTPNSQSSKQCLKVSSASGAATRLKVSGQGVLTAAFTGSGDGSLPTLTATANQTLLVAT